MNDVAVLLNANAKGVTPRVVDSLRQHIPEGNLFLSTSVAQAHDHTRRIMSGGYSTVVTGGGDGTLVTFLNQSMSCLDDGPSGGCRTYPTIGVLKLGTGNGIGSYVGADSYERDLRLMLEGRAASRRPLALIEAVGRLSYFAGFGLDANILSDYFEGKQSWIGKTLGYAGTIPFISLPRQATVRRHNPTVTIVNEGGPAFPIDRGGEPVGPPLRAGETLYHGPATIAGVSTTPYYGYDFKLYPFADKRPGAMQLRVASTPWYEILGRLPAIWRGTFRSPTIHDFYCDRVRVTWDRPIPFQIAGEAAGDRQEVTFELSSRQVDLIDLSAATSATIH